MKIYCGTCFREGSSTANPRVGVLYNQQLLNTTTSARKDNQVAIPTVTIPTPFFFQSVRGDVSFVSENNARIVFDTLPSPPFFFGTGWTTPTSNQQNTKRHNHTSVEISVRAPTCLWRFIRCTTRKTLPSRNPFTSWRSRAWFSLNQSSISPPLSGRACRITRQDVRTISVASRHTHWKWLTGAWKPVHLKKKVRKKKGKKNRR